MRAQEQIERVTKLFRRVQKVTESSPNISVQYKMMADILEWVLNKEEQKEK